MHRYEELEKLYYKNKIKKIFIISVFVIIAISGYFIYKNNSVTDKNSNKTQINDNIEKIAKQSENVKPDLIKSDINKTSKSGIKNQELNNIKKIENLSGTNAVKNVSTIPHLSFELPKTTDYNASKYVNNEHVKNSNVNSIKKKKTIKAVPVIKEKQINIKSLIKLFNNNPSYDNAIIISKFYYNNNNLKNAKLWALKANNIDPAKYESWKMFALILLKKNDKIKAKEVLNIYLNDYGHNDEIYKLLRSINE